MNLHPYLHLVGHHLQVQVGTVSRDAEVGLVSREAAVAQHERHDDYDQEPHREEQQPPKEGRSLPLRVCIVLAPSALGAAAEASAVAAASVASKCGSEPR